MTGSFYVDRPGAARAARDRGVASRRRYPPGPWIAPSSSASPTASNEASSARSSRRFERKGLRIVALEQRTLDRETLARHYEEHVGKGFYDDLVAFMSRGPAVVLVLEGPQDTYKVVRTMMGATNPREAAPGTIRGDLGIELTENLVHGSDSQESAAREIGIWFPGL